MSTGILAALAVCLILVVRHFFIVSSLLARIENLANELAKLRRTNGQASG